MNKMKIIADEAIPYLKGIFENECEVEYYPGSEITPQRVKDADALIVRTRTKCNAQLLEGSKVKVIASATIGTDHIDRAWCQSHNIALFNAPGCNSGGVLQYFLTALFKCLSTRELWQKFLNSAPDAGSADAGAADGAAAGSVAGVDGTAEGTATAAGDSAAESAPFTVGVIGVGNVGSKVAAACESLGFEVLRNDPPKERQQTLAYNSGYLRIVDFKDYYSLDYLLENSDVVTLHVPLDETTRGMADASFFARMKPGAIFINSSRGEVVDEAALLANLHKLAAVVLDVWVGEPNINKELLQSAFIATPHIAGYSAEGKIKGTQMVVEAIRRYMRDNGLTASTCPAGAAADGFAPAKTAGATPAASCTHSAGATLAATALTTTAGAIPAAAGTCTIPEEHPIPVDFRGKNIDEISQMLERIFPIQELSNALKANPHTFEEMRNNYHYRHELEIL
ncbi:MAG: 4-phosphoerythronate dehydrogenase [Candidatus Egerieousia sp.]|nr:4-phosphoerythronate dehydrogenase [Candidatus Egerieousia sp.]